MLLWRLEKHKYMHKYRDLVRENVLCVLKDNMADPDLLF